MAEEQYQLYEYRLHKQHQYKVATACACMQAPETQNTHTRPVT